MPQNNSEQTQFHSFQRSSRRNRRDPGWCVKFKVVC